MLDVVEARLSRVVGNRVSLAAPFTHGCTPRQVVDRGLAVANGVAAGDATDAAQVEASFVAAAAALGVEVNVGIIISNCPFSRIATEYDRKPAGTKRLSTAAR